MLAFIVLSLSLVLSAKASPSAGYGAAALAGTLEDKDLVAELEKIVANLDEEQLDKLENILSKDLDATSELSMITQELTEMGMDVDDIEDLLDIADAMTIFLERIPEITAKLELTKDDYKLADHVKLYLLGLPNKLGPLGFLALHSVLQAADEVDEDVKIGEFTSSAPASFSSVQPVGDIIARKLKEAQGKSGQTGSQPFSGTVTYKAGSANQKDSDTLVKDILNRRRRALNL